MVAKEHMSLTELKNYRKYLVETENQLVDQTSAMENISSEMMAKIDWYREELETTEFFLEERLRQQVTAEEEAAAEAWLHPKEQTRPGWWSRLLKRLGYRKSMWY